MNIIDLFGGGQTLGGASVPRNPLARSRQGATIKGIVFHHSGGTSLVEAMTAGQHKGVQHGTGAQYYIDRDGTVYQYAPDSMVMSNIRNPVNKFRTDRASPTHALKNANVIGIEVIASDSNHFTDAQIKAAGELGLALSTKYKIPPAMVVSHGQLQGGAGGNKMSNEGGVLAAAAKGLIEASPQAGASWFDPTKPPLDIPGSTIYVAGLDAIQAVAPRVQRTAIETALGFTDVAAKTYAVNLDSGPLGSKVSGMRSYPAQPPKSFMLDAAGFGSLADDRTAAMLDGSKFNLGKPSDGIIDGAPNVAPTIVAWLNGTSDAMLAPSVGASRDVSAEVFKTPWSAPTAKPAAAQPKPAPIVSEDHPKSNAVPASEADRKTISSVAVVGASGRVAIVQHAEAPAPTPTVAPQLQTIWVHPNGANQVGHALTYGEFQSELGNGTMRQLKLDPEKSIVPSAAAGTARAEQTAARIAAMPKPGSPALKPIPSDLSEQTTRNEQALDRQLTRVVGGDPIAKGLTSMAQGISSVVKAPTIQRTVLAPTVNPAWVKWDTAQKKQAQLAPSTQAIAKLTDIHDARDAATMQAQAPRKAPTVPPPPKYLMTPKTVQVEAPVPHNRPAGNGGGASIATASYTIRKGDTLAAIAARSGQSLASLIARNGISDPNKIYAGDKLLVAGAPASKSTAAVLQAQRKTTAAVTVAPAKSSTSSSKAVSSAPVAVSKATGKTLTATTISTYDNDTQSWGTRTVYR